MMPLAIQILVIAWFWTMVALTAAIILLILSWREEL